MKLKEQFWIDYLIDYFNRKDTLRESDFKRFGELAEMDAKKLVIVEKKK